MKSRARKSTKVQPVPAKPYEFSQEVLAAGLIAPRHRLYGDLRQVPGRGRTAYFYRKMAIEFARDARSYRFLEKIYPGNYDLWKRIALSYLASFKRMKGVVCA